MLKHFLIILHPTSKIILIKKEGLQIKWQIKKLMTFSMEDFFEIPKYQRGYAWEKENIRDLFDDIIESIESDSNHYIGTIVLSKSADDKEKFYVVDGQQRVTTITLIINSLIKQLSPEDFFYYNRFYIKDSQRYRILPLNRDRYFFSNLLESNVEIPENKSQRYLKEAIEEVAFKVSEIKDKLKFLKSVEKLEVMEFVEDSEGDAIRIFLTVNDRGKLLSNMEKVKSLLIYFSNRYLNKELDDSINNCFSDIFEVYDDIKHLGEELGIDLIKNKKFDEDNLMRYHFVTFSNEEFDPTASYVLEYLKNKLTELRNNGKENNYADIETFINSYINSLKNFFIHCKNVIEKAKIDTKYFKLFVILDLSATLYPLIIKLEMRGLLDEKLTGIDRTEFSFFDLVELIEVRVYKTRATDPKADIARFAYEFDNKTLDEIENWLIWFNQRWMPEAQFQSNLFSRIYGNRALNHIFIDYSESIRLVKYTIDGLKNIVADTPTIEHILAQTPTFAPTAFDFNENEDFINHEHTLGNLTILKKSLNSKAQNKSPIEKVSIYDDIANVFTMTKKLASDIDTKKGFTKIELQERTKEIAGYCINRWWCD